jgi:hypothetical protein
MHDQAGPATRTSGRRSAAGAASAASGRRAVSPHTVWQCQQAFSRRAIGESHTGQTRGMWRSRTGQRSRVIEVAPARPHGSRRRPSAFPVTSDMPPFSFVWDGRLGWRDAWYDAGRRATSEQCPVRTHHDSGGDPAAPPPSVWTSSPSADRATHGDSGFARRTGARIDRRCRSAAADASRTPQGPGRRPEPSARSSRSAGLCWLRGRKGRVG